MPDTITTIPSVGDIVQVRNTRLQGIVKRINRTSRHPIVVGFKEEGRLSESRYKPSELIILRLEA